MRVRNLIGAALLAACGVANASQWHEITTDTDNEYRYDMKAKSLITTATVALITVRDVNLQTHQISFELMGLGLKSCTRQMGELHVFDVKGTLLYSQEFVLGGESVAAQIAETICDLAQSRAAHTRAPAADL